MRAWFGKKQKSFVCAPMRGGAALLFVGLSFLFASCSQGISTSARGGGSSITGYAIPFIGLVQNDPIQSNFAPARLFASLFWSDATAAGCSATANIYALSPATGDKVGSVLATAYIKPDGSYTITDTSQLNASLLGATSGVGYQVEASGCGVTHSRAITGFTSQDVTAASTLINYVTNVSSGKKLTDVEPEKVAALLKKIPVSVASTEQNIYNWLAAPANAAVKSEFEQLFSISLTDLLSSAPRLLAVTAPTAVNENATALYSVATSHWNPGYNIVYLWKRDGVTVSTSSSYSYSTDADDAGLHSVVLYVGKDDGSGNVDMTKPFQTQSYAVTVANDIPPTAPSFTLGTPSSSPLNTRNLTLTLNTGVAMANCASFTGLAITDNDTAAPANPALYTVTCSSAVTQNVNYTLASAGDGVKTIRIWARDSNGMISAAPTSLSVDLDTAAPSLAAGSMQVNAGAATTTTNYVQVSLGGSDTGHNITKFCLKYNSSTTPASSDSCWVAVDAPLPGLTLATTLSLVNYNFQLGFGAGVYTVYAWLMDTAGNISAMTNAGGGTLAQDKAQITYTPGAPPVISSIAAIGSDLPATQPPGLSDLAVASGATVYVRWTASGSLTATPISVYYKLTSGSTWQQVATGLLNGNNGGCTVDDPGTTQTETGCYVWANGSPSNSPYQIQVRAADTNSMVSLSTSSMLNPGQILMLGGNSDPGVGGSAKSATYFATGGGDFTYVNQFAIAPNGYAFIYDSRGLFRIKPSDGINKLFIPATGTNNVTSAGVLASAATLDRIYGVTMDFNGNVLLRTTNAILRFPSSVDNPTVTKIIGGGATTADGTAPLSYSLGVSNMNSAGGAAYAMLTSLPNGDIYFNQNYALYYYRAADGLIHRITFSGTGVYGAPALDYTSCNGAFDFGLSFNTATSALTSLMFDFHCASTANYPLARVDPLNFTALTTFPVGAGLYGPYGFVNGFRTGLDGNLYYVRIAAGTIGKVDPVNNTASYVVGNGTVGYCPDGTLATSCALTPQDVFVTQNGTIYFLDGGTIRTILSDGTVYTLYGAFGADGDGSSALAAHLTGSYSVQKSTDGKIQIFQNDFNVIREIGTTGIINRIAGNWLSGAPNLATAATSTKLVGKLGWGYPSNMFTDPATADVYYVDSAGIYKLTRTTSQWSRLVGGGATVANSADGLNGTQLNFTPGGAFNIFNQGSKIYLAATYNTGSPAIYNIRSYDGLSNYVQALVAGANVSSGPAACTSTSAATGCLLPFASATNSGVPFFDDVVGGQMFLPYKNFNIIWVYQGGNFTSQITTAQNVYNATYRKNASNQEIIYYCNGTAIYEKNLTAGTEAVLPNWPSGFKCSSAARNMIYDAAANSLIFIFDQNNLNGVAAYYLAN